MIITPRHLDAAKHEAQAVARHAMVAGGLMLLLVALLPVGRCYGNPLGITVAATADAGELLQQAGAPSLSTRRCVVVTFVDPVGPCANALTPSMAITQINGDSIADETAFTQAVDKLKPGMEVAIKGLYVRRGVGSKGSWAVGAVKVQIPQPKALSDDQNSLPPAMNATSRKDRGDLPSGKAPSLGGTEKTAAEQIMQGVSEPQAEPLGEMGNSHQQAPEFANALQARRLKEEGDAAADIPCVPFGVRCEGFADYDQNDPHFSKVDYKKGPSGQTLYTVYFLDEGEDNALCPTTAEGYIVDDIDAKANSIEDAAELQNYLREALEADRFLYHGRVATWEIIGDMPRTASGVGEGALDANVSSLWEGKVRPQGFSWYWAGQPHGVSRLWGKDRTSYAIGRSVHGIRHLSHEGEDEEGRGVIAHKFGFAHGPGRSWWKNGNRKGQWERQFDKLTGDFLKFYENGAPQLAQKYDRGLKEGVATEWFEDGTVKVRCEWKAGALDGKWEEFFPNGQKKSISYWKSGELAKDEQCWDESGRSGVGRKKAVPPYQFGFEQGEAMGKDDHSLLSAIEARGDSVDNPFALGRVRGRTAKFRGELFEAERQVSKGADTRLLDMAKGRYEGYLKGVGTYGSR
jgi:hypothetical protein